MRRPRPAADSTSPKSAAAWLSPTSIATAISIFLLTTNNGPAYLYRNDQAGGNRSIRFRLVGTKSNRDAIGAIVRIYHNGQTQTRMVHGGSSYLSQSELPVTFGVGKRDKIDRATVEWPSGRTEEFKDLVAGKAYQCIEGKGVTDD